MRVRALTSILAAALLLAGCGSSPLSRYYTLTGIPAASPVPAGASAPQVAIGKVIMPSILDRPQIATRLTPTQLDFAETRRWAGPLDQLVRQALADDLDARMGRPVLTADLPSGRVAIDDLTLAIGEFDADSSGTVTLEASWTLTPSRDALEPTASGETTLHQAPLGAEAGDVAQTMSRALAALADRIVARIGAQR